MPVLQTSCLLARYGKRWSFESIYLIMIMIMVGLSSLLCSSLVAYLFQFIVQRYQLCFHKISPHASTVFNLREPGRPQGLVLSQGRVNLFKCSQGSNSVANPTVPGLQRIKLTNLPKLKSLSRQRETWPHLAYVEVIGCGSHKTLPLSKRSADATKEIVGELERCNQLEWDSIDIESKLQPFSKDQRPR